MTLRPTIGILTAIMLLASAGACGTTEDTGEQEGDDARGGPVSVTDARGNDVSLDQPASDVVTLEWGEAEMVKTLGVDPVGVAEVETFGTWVTSVELDDDVEDVGTRQEPSVDSIVALEPDLVIASEEHSSQLLEQMEEYTDVLVTKTSDASDNIPRMRDDFTMIAEALGKEDKATEVLDDFDAALAAGKKEIADAGTDGESFVVADGYEEGNVLSIRPFGEGALVSQIGIELGLRNAWPGDGDERWGLSQTDVEGLTTISDSDVTFMYNASDGNDLFAEGLANNPIWQDLPFVAAGNVHRLSDGMWAFGGPLSCEQYIDEFVEVYTS